MMKRHHIPQLLIALLFTTLAIVLFNQPSSESYADFVANHPYHPSNSRISDLKSIPKQDRPDLAWEQNFLMTMDPSLKRPAPERLKAGREQIAAYFARKSRARTGSEAFPWEERGPSAVGGRTRAIMWDPNDTDSSKVWAGGVSGGLWVNENIHDANSEWQKVDDFWENIGVTAITYDPLRPDTLYVGTGESNGGATRGEGIYRSTDGGVSWARLAATSGFYFINDLVVREENGNGVLYAAVTPTFYRGDFHGIESLGLQRSTNGGDSFTQVLDSVPNTNTVHAIADLELAADNQLWVGTVGNVYGEGGGFILSSTDGTNWEVSTQRDPGDRVMLSSAPSNPDVIYAVVESSNAVEEIIKTSDDGLNWTNLEEPSDADTDIDPTDFTRGQAWYDLIIRVDPNDENTVLIGGIDLFKTSDGGTTWDQLSHWYGGFGYQYVHADQHAILYLPGSSSDVLFGNDGGIALSSTMDLTDPVIVIRNNLYNVTQFYSCAIHPTQDDYYLAGSQDNGTQQFTQIGLGSTVDIFGGDGGYCFIDQSDGNFQISSYVYNYFGLSTQNGLINLNGSSSFNSFSEDQESGRFINPADYDDSLGILYTAADAASIGRFTDIRGDGTPVRGDLQVDLLGDLASHVRVSPFHSESTTLFVGTGIGKVIKIDSAHQDNVIVNDLTSNLPEGYISCIEIGASEDQLLATYSSYGVTKVWESMDGGASWTSRDGNLPDIPVRWALYNPNNRLEVILATELGIWRTVNINATDPVWEPSNVGLANVRVDMLQIRTSDYQVIAATHGRGLYSSNGFTASIIPNAPSDLIATVNSPFEVALEWIDNSDDETSFLIERSSDGSTFTEVVSLDPNEVSYTDMQLADGTTYFYRVSALNNAGGSEYTTLVEVMTPVARPDFSFTNFDVNQDIDQIILMGNMTNTGFLAQQGAIDVTVYWSDQSTFDAASAEVFYTTSLNGLVVDETRPLSASLDIPAGFLQGSIHFFGFIDENNAIEEDDEENNTISSSIDFTPLSAFAPSSIKVYPVPFERELMIEWPTASLQSVGYRIIDLGGKEVANGLLSQTGTTNIVLGKLNKGVYQLLIFRDGNQVSSHRIIKR